MAIRPSPTRRSAAVMPSGAEHQRSPRAGAGQPFACRKWGALDTGASARAGGAATLSLGGANRLGSIRARRRGGLRGDVRAVRLVRSIPRARGDAGAGGLSDRPWPEASPALARGSLFNASRWTTLETLPGANRRPRSSGRCPSLPDGTEGALGTARVRFGPQRFWASVQLGPGDRDSDLGRIRSLDLDTVYFDSPTDGLKGPYLLRFGDLCHK